MTPELTPRIRTIRMTDNRRLRHQLVLWRPAFVNIHGEAIRRRGKPDLLIVRAEDEACGSVIAYMLADHPRTSAALTLLERGRALAAAVELLLPLASETAEQGGDPRVLGLVAEIERLLDDVREAGV
jgi:hypothetical protein